MGKCHIIRKANQECLDLLMRKKDAMCENGRSLHGYRKKLGREAGLALYGAHVADLAFAFGQVRHWEERETWRVPMTKEDVKKAILFAEGEEEKGK